MLLWGLLWDVDDIFGVFGPGSISTNLDVVKV
jgi:hypothetical protein